MTQPSRGTIHQVELYTILTNPTTPSPIPGCFSLTKAYFISRDGWLPLSSGKKAIFPSGRELYPIRLSHTRLAWALIETKSLPSSSLPPDPDLPFENSVGYPTELDGSTSHPLPRGEYELELDQAHCSPAMRKNAYFESSKDLLNSIRGILLNRRNIPIMSMPIESMLLAVNSNFLVFSVSSDDMMGQSFASLVPTVAAAESAIGLAIFVITFRVRGTIAGQGLSRWASASDSKARKMLFAAILSICASSSKKISIYNEEMIVARCFIGFIIFSRKSLGKTFKETPAGSGVVVPAKTALRDVVTSASVDVMNCWAVPSSSVSTRNRWELGSTLPFFIFFFSFILLAEPVYAMEPAVLPPQLEWLNALPERDLFSRIRVLEGRDYYNLPPQNNPGEYEGLVREHLAQAIDRPHRQEILKSEGVEIGILERKGILQNQLLVLMRNEKNILDSYSTRTGAELLTFLGPSLRQGAALLFPPFPRV
ncbi:NADH dehydrogenase subunit 4L, mitochondrial [Tanacetum coccineum]